MKKNLFWLSVLMISSVLLLNCGNNEAQTNADSPKQNTKPAQNVSTKIESMKADSTKAATPKVTFVELGSVSCIPCKMMQPIMKAVEEDYGDQIEIVFYDVWKDATPGKKYDIRVIPTQVFLDESGKEFYRHEGFLPKENIDSLLVKKGLKIKTKTEQKKI